MKFYNREQELKTLRETKDRAQHSAQMTFIVGRRRIGKTALILECFPKDLVYFFVSKKSEPLLCQEFILQLQKSLNINVLGEFNQFSRLFEYILEVSKTQHFTLAIDEFQEFFSLSPAIYSEIQHLWDRYKNQSKLNLVLSGSIYSLMSKIFEHAKEPLYGRADNKMLLKPFSISTLHTIYSDYQGAASPRDMLSFYTLTGGVAKYVEILVNHHAFNLDAMLDVFFKNGSLFIHEGRDILIEEFGKDYTVYFSILALIAHSKTSRSELESILQKSTGGYLERLEHDFNLIKRIKPIFAKPNTKTQKYEITDNFLKFWFRFIYKYQSAIEIENFDYVKDIIKSDFDTYSGNMLENYLIEKLKASKQFNKIGRYWERGNLNEIDIVAVNERKKFALIAEVKLAKKRIQINVLKEKAQALSKHLTGYQIHYEGFSLDDLFTPVVDYETKKS